MHYKFPLTIMAVVIIVIIIGLFYRTEPAADGLQKVFASGVLRIGYANEAPFAWNDRATGAVVGEAPAIARAMAQRLGVQRVEGVLSEFGALIPGLKAGRFDVIAAGMYITPERAQQVRFSRPTCRIGCGFVILGSGIGSTLHAYEDVRDHATARLGVVAGAIEQGLAREVGIPAERTVTFADSSAAIEGLVAGRIEAFACTALTARDLAKRSEGRCQYAEPFRDPLIHGRSAAGYGAFAFRREDTALSEAFERQLATFVGSQEHRDLVSPFGFDASMIPVGVDVAAVVAGSAP